MRNYLLQLVRLRSLVLITRFPFAASGKRKAKAIYLFFIYQMGIQGTQAGDCFPEFARYYHRRRVYSLLAIRFLGSFWMSVRCFSK